MCAASIRWYSASSISTKIREPAVLEPTADSSDVLLCRVHSIQSPRVASASSLCEPASPVKYIFHKGLPISPAKSKHKIDEEIICKGHKGSGNIKQTTRHCHSSFSTVIINSHWQSGYLAKYKYIRQTKQTPARPRFFFFFSTYSA